MRIAILKETAALETRVALMPEAVKSLIGQGMEVVAESGCGQHAGALTTTTSGQEPGSAAGRSCWPRPISSRGQLPARRGAEEDEAGRHRCRLSAAAGCSRQELQAAVERGVTLFSMELVPRITRAQAMDALSSMATVAGYKAVSGG